MLERLPSEEDQFGGLQCNADFLDEFALRRFGGRFSGLDVAAGWCVEAAEIGVAGARAGLQEGADDAGGRAPGRSDEDQADAVAVAIRRRATFAAYGTALAIKERDEFVGHEVG